MVGRSRAGGSSVITKLQSALDVKAEEARRVSTAIEEFDRVLGGGMVPGQVILLAGDPGIGKSTLITQIAREFGSKKVLYVCGEESPQQIKLRIKRVSYNGANLYFLNETSADAVVDALEQGDQFSLIIVDSIQTITTSQLAGAAGSVGQVRESAAVLSSAAKRLNIPLILIGHVTKEGAVAGPKVLEHMVDTVLYLEGDSQHMFRMLRTVKNRFGPTNEVGIFEMTEKGMEQVNDPSKLFLSERLEAASGSCVTVVMEGFRPILFEIQALTTRTTFGYPVRTTSGFNVNRLKVLIAILEKRCGLNLGTHDVFVNVAGGFKISEYAADLAVCLAVASSLKEKPVGSKVLAFGECGLSGEIRRVAHEEKRIKEAKKLGFDSVISPSSVKSIKEAVEKI